MSVHSLPVFGTEDTGPGPTPAFIQQLKNNTRSRQPRSHSPKSHHSGNNSHKSNSSKSSITSMLARKRAQAEAIQAGMEFSKREADLRRHQALILERQHMAQAKSARIQAEMEAELVYLKQQKELAQTTAEVEALQSMTFGFNMSDVRSVLPKEDSTRRTQRYVNSLTPNDNDIQNTVQHSTPPDCFATPDPTRKLMPNSDSDFVTVSEVPISSTERSKPMLNPTAPNFYPRTVMPELPCPQYPVRDNNASFTTEITRFLLKKELLLSRLSTYNDQPESYSIWKAGFSNIMVELQVTATEELDLLVKYLGPESANYARSLRAASVNNPRQGLNRVWDRLDERYGSPELVEAALKSKLYHFPKLTNKDSKKLYDLADILSEIEATKEDRKYSALLSYFDASSGVSPIVCKLPYNLQERWTNQATSYKKLYGVTYPPFSYFVDFVRDMSKIKNDPSFFYEVTQKEKSPVGHSNTRQTVHSRKTDVAQTAKSTSDFPSKCPVHNTRHTLNECRGFRLKPIEERKLFLKDNSICFRCCASSSHMAKSCTETIKCDECGSDRHPTALHIQRKTLSAKQNGDHGYNTPKAEDASSQVLTKCTQICGDQFNGKSCGKTILVKVYPKGQVEKARNMYAILDDQSNMSLAKSNFFELFNIQSGDIPYELSSCAGHIQTSGRRASGFIIESTFGNTRMELPTLIECNQIPSVREEIPTPDVAIHHSHLHDIAKDIPPLDNDSHILLLIGRDLPDAHHVQQQRTGPRNSPYAQKLPLGWVIVGETCLGKVHKPDSVNVLKTQLLSNGRVSLFKPCPNNFEVKENLDPSTKDYRMSSIFDTSKDDNKPGQSIEDKQFVKIMDSEISKGPLGNLVAPLPFRSTRQRLPNNRTLAVQRAKSLKQTLKNPIKRQHFVEFMQKVFDKGHAELAPPLQDGEEAWYLPIFGVYHPKKPNQVRVVFDSSAKFEGISLNDVLLRGPDLTNSLLGILLRFRDGPVAVTADVEQMFHSFHVREDHRNYLRFLWHRDNNPENELTEYRMCVHVFGNSPSPAVATYGMRHIAMAGSSEFGHDVLNFINRNFYVDDALSAQQTTDAAIDLMKRTQTALKTGGNLRLHKITSNNAQVMEAFPPEDHAKDLKNLDLSIDQVPLQRSLGLTWDLKSDTFTFQVSQDPKPYTRRGILSTVNSIFDPIGFIAPVTVQGKLLLRDLMAESTGWDEPLSVDRKEEWDRWRESLDDLQALHIARSYSPIISPSPIEKQIHVFSDASEKAIAAVVHMKTIHQDGTCNTNFVLGKAKVAPTHGHTIPRLELCAAVLAVQLAEQVMDQLDIPVETMRFYTDSKVVLGYLHNETRRFHIYVSNRVELIRKLTKPHQWTYVPSSLNPADDGTRCVPSSSMSSSSWLQGSAILSRDNENTSQGGFQLTDPDNDKEVRRQVIALKSGISEITFGSHRFERFSSWSKLVETLARLKHIACSFKSQSPCNGWHVCTRSVEGYMAAKEFIIKQVQREVFEEEIQCIINGKSIPKHSSIISLSPVLDGNGLLRVGGRLNRANLRIEDKNPLIIPGRHYIATLLVRHHHELVKHQGRHFTEGAVRAAGLWITGCKRLISSLIHHCVKCRKLRGTTCQQKMSDLPADRITPGPPFTSVGVDTFGPWSVVSRRTRGGQASSKRWAILFTCLTTRAVHIEVVEELSSSAFINALRRFISIRGPVQLFRSDRGTNFIGAVDELQFDAINVEDGPVRDFLFSKRTQWFFNPPHSSHMGGAWERLIGTTRRILESMMTEVTAANLTHDVLTTFLAEVCAIINARPITTISSDPEDPSILNPSTLLTQKVGVFSESPGTYDLKDLYRAQWKRVQALADTFWNRWKGAYLQNLQIRRKWQIEQPNINEGDLVLLKDKDVQRHDWLTGVILSTLPGGDGRVRKATVRVSRQGEPTTYTRPITELVVLVPAKQE